MSLLLEIEQICRDRGIDRDVLIETIEAAMKSAAKKVFGEQREIEAVFNEETGEIELRIIMIVAEADIDGEVDNPSREITLEEAREYADPYAEVGDELLFPIFFREEDVEQAREQDRRFGQLLKLETARHQFGRIAAQTAKQVIIQKLREAERQNIYEEFKDKKNELITGIVRRFERGSLIIDLGRTDAILPSSQQVRRESYRAHDRILAYVLDVQRSSRDAQVVLSRTDPGLVIKLFEHEVPEIQEGIVKIVAVAREAGVRSKVAVYSTDSDVDPVGACVGMRGARVQSVVQELRGEKIDIVPYHSDVAKFVCNAISPAQVSKVFVDEGRRAMELIVPDDQLSLAIGRSGQNVRLAAQLTGWNLEILNETRLEEMKQEAKARLLEYEGVDSDLVDRLFSLGYNKLEDIALADANDIAQLPGFNEDRAASIIAAATDLLDLGDEDDEFVTEADLEREALMKIRGVGEKVAAAIYDAGYAEPLFVAAENDPERFSKLTGLDLKKCKQILAASDKWYDQQGFSEEEREEHEQDFADFRAEFAAILEEREAAGDLEEEDEGEGAPEEVIEDAAADEEDED